MLHTILEPTRIYNKGNILLKIILLCISPTKTFQFIFSKDKDEGLDFVLLLK